MNNKIFREFAKEFMDDVLMSEEYHPEFTGEVEDFFTKKFSPAYELLEEARGWIGVEPVDKDEERYVKELRSRFTTLLREDNRDRPPKKAALPPGRRYDSIEELSDDWQSEQEESSHHQDAGDIPNC